ncbi:MAG TPA: DUF3015 family protein [bacterium]|nr:DUF3015 family protein [bacterium]
MSARSGTETVAVMQFDASGASNAEITAASDRLQEELLKTGKFTVVDRQQINDILNEQALQQTGCTSTECAVQVGRILGVRKLVVGRINGLDATHWIVSASLVDVETAQTLRTSSVQYKGSFFDFLSSGMPLLAARIAGTSEQAVAAAPIHQSAAQSTASAADGKSIHDRLEECYAEVGSRYRVWYVIGYISSLTPGLTTLTSMMNDRGDCERRYKVSAREFDQLLFVYNNLPRVLQDMSKGNGPYLASLSELMGCGATEYPRFARMTQERFPALAANADRSGEALLVTLRREMEQRPVLAGCLRRA